MFERIFDVNEPLASKGVIQYDLAPSQQLGAIRSLVSLAKRNQLAAINEQQKDKKKKLTFDDLVSGLPSPPVESPLSDFASLPVHPPLDDTPPMTPNATTSSCSSSSSSTTSSSVDEPTMSVQDIHEKLQSLRDEKHRLFQLMKQLVVQEDQQKKKQQQQKQLEQQHRSSSSWSGALPTPIHTKSSASVSSNSSSTTLSPRPSLSSRPIHRSQSYTVRSHPYQRPTPPSNASNASQHHRSNSSYLY
ncbi:hypothetical protein BC940DRAFT_289027 [Gongronella butleri]|nr:hypothetical protein BC940DRAFT_289027 [Gongronella butleri]